MPADPDFQTTVNPRLAIPGTGPVRAHPFQSSLTRPRTPTPARG